MTSYATTLHENRTNRINILCEVETLVATHDMERGVWGQLTGNPPELNQIRMRGKTNYQILKELWPYALDDRYEMMASFERRMIQRIIDYPQLCETSPGAHPTTTWWQNKGDRVQLGFFSADVEYVAKAKLLSANLLRKFQFGCGNESIIGVRLENDCLESEISEIILATVRKAPQPAATTIAIVSSDVAALAALKAGVIPIKVRTPIKVGCQHCEWEGRSRADRENVMQCVSYTALPTVMHEWVDHNS